MMPIAPLMIEHRLIERMIGFMNKEADRIRQGTCPDADFIDAAVDFIKTYADKLHHGKEEDILFKVLAKKSLPAEHGRIMDELIKEHAQGRGNVKKLAEANKRCAQGEEDAVKEILENMDILTEFYPKHIEKEDKHFFIPVMKYLNEEEKEEMLGSFNEFDKRFIHAKYQSIVEGLESDK